MPIYEYRCGTCGFQKEFLQKLNDAPLTTCPECGKDSYAKQLSAAGFQLKGSGWYATDFKGGGAAASTAAAAAPAAAPAADSSAPAAPSGGTPCGGSCACH